MHPPQLPEKLACFFKVQLAEVFAAAAKDRLADFFAFARIACLSSRFPIVRRGVVRTGSEVFSTINRGARKIASKQFRHGRPWRASLLFMRAADRGGWRAKRFGKLARDESENIYSRTLSAGAGKIRKHRQNKIVKI